MSATGNGKIYLSIFSPERKVVERTECVSVTLPGTEGQIQVLSGHAAMVGVLETGLLTYSLVNGESVTSVVSTGFFEIQDDEARVFAETFEYRDEIDLARAKAAQTKAEQALGTPDLDEHQFRKYQLKLQRALIRQQVGA
jgi:F-type H+-transporting ATPase subunit epsilon